MIHFLPVIFTTLDKSLSPTLLSPLTLRACTPVKNRFFSIRIPVESLRCYNSVHIVYITGEEFKLKYMIFSQILDPRRFIAR